MGTSRTLQKNKWATGKFTCLSVLFTWLQKLPNKVTPAPFRLMQIGSAFWQSRVLYVATQLDIATALGDECLSVDDLSSQISTHPDSTYRLLRMLSAMGVFEEVTAKKFRNNTLSSCLRCDHPNNVRAMILMHNSEVMSWPWFQQLERGVRNNEIPFQLTHGHDLFEYMDNHAQFDGLFSSAMDCVEALAGDSYSKDFDWSQFDRIIDIGGSKGSKSLSILKRHPQLQALIVDRAQPISTAEEHWAGHEDEWVLSRMRFQIGDLFESIPEATNNKDIYLLSAVLHCFDNDSCVRVLNNLAEACGNTGARIAVMEIVLDKTHADLTSTTFDMQMLMGTRGRERSLEQWTDLFKQSALQLEEVINLQSPGKILVLRAM